MRKFIEIMESISSTSLVEQIAAAVRQGEHEGFSPYWKLQADERLLNDEAAMMHISELISAGFTSGHHPSWDLVTVEGEPKIDPVSPISAEPHAAIVDEEAEDIFSDAPEMIQKHNVVPVHQREGEGQGWWECPDEHAECFVVEDDEGNPIESHPDRNSAEAHAHGLNNPVMLDEEGAATMYENEPDYKVEVAAMHERGHAQDEAFLELDRRNITLTDTQLTQAGR